MNICVTSHQRPPMLPLMHMHEGLLSTWCSFWQNGSSWHWNQQGSLQKFVRLTSSSFMIRISGSNRSGSTCIRLWYWTDKGVTHALSLGWCAVCARMKQSRVVDPARSRCAFAICTFAPIWMAQPIVHNFRRMSMADLRPREPGYFDYKEGWYEWDGKSKHEEETFAGHTMGCIRLMITDNNVEQFHYHNWRPIEHFAA